MDSLLAMSSAEKWSTGGITALIGLGMTFVMLALLIGSILLLRIILKGLETCNPKIKEKFSAIFHKQKKDESVAVTDSSPVEPSEPEVDEDTKRVVESAVRTYVASSDDGKPHDRIRILSVKEVSHE